MKKVITIISGGLFVLVAALAIFIATFNVDNYRNQIADTLSKESGRAVKLGGAISLGFSTSGVTLHIRDAAIGNPSWASRPTMAGIGSFDLGLSLPPLLSKKFVITRLEIKNADIQLETSHSGEHNWEMESLGQKGGDAKKPQPSAASPVAISISSLSIKDSQLTMRNENGEASVFKVGSMTLGGTSGVSLKFDGDYNNAPVTIALNTGAKDLFSMRGAWPFDVTASYAAFKLEAKGNADLDSKQASLSSYEVDAGHTTLVGKMNVTWGGTRPDLRGTLTSDRISPDDFKTGGAGKGGAVPSSSGASSGRVFSPEPLPSLDALKSADADMDIRIGQIVLSNGILKNTSTKMQLQNGALSLSPFSMEFGDGDEVKGQIRVVASGPPQIAANFSAPEIRMQDALGFFGVPAFLEGNAAVEVNLAGHGESMHTIASSAVGVMNVTSAGGTISRSATGSIASGLMELFAPSGSNTLNCLAVRFIIKDGVARDNGILVDTSATTVAGTGGFDLGQEKLGLLLHAKAKSVDIGSLVPPLRVSGSFLEPNFQIDPSETVQNVAGVFLGGGSLNSSVPDIASVKGQNACVYTIEHPSAATSAKGSTLPSTLTGRVKSGLDGVGGLLRGFMGQQQ